jgi:nucleoside-diphosphate-sugar epimerase
MKILITGTSGFLGAIIRNILSDNNVFDLNRFSGNYKLDLGKHIPCFDNQFDLVIHAAGLAHTIPNSKVDIEKFYNINVVGTLNLLKGLEQFFIPKKIVYISTVAVYGETSAVMVNEESALKATDPYGKSKIEAEFIVRTWCEEHNVICTIIRLPLVVGKNPPGNLSAMIRGINKGYYFNIAGGNAKKSMVLASDIAKFILKAAEVGGTYNLTDGYHPTFFELSNLIAKRYGKRNPKNLPYWFARLIGFGGDILGSWFPLNSMKLKKITSDLTFDDSKARKTFGWNPTPVLKGF